MTCDLRLTKSRMRTLRTSPNAIARVSPTSARIASTSSTRISYVVAGTIMAATACESEQIEGSYCELFQELQCRGT